MNLDAWPEGTRLIVRRERPHPGAQLTLFDTIEGMRHIAFITETTGADIADLDLGQDLGHWFSPSARLTIGPASLSIVSGEAPAVTQHPMVASGQQVTIDVVAEISRPIVDIRPIWAITTLPIGQPMTDSSAQDHFISYWRAASMLLMVSPSSTHLTASRYWLPLVKVAPSGATNIAQKHPAGTPKV